MVLRESVTFIGAKITVQADETIEHYGNFVIAFLIDGNYDKSKVPDLLYLDYFFMVKNDKIVTLIIIKKKQKSAK